jgi:hypothetical protein
MTTKTHDFRSGIAMSALGDSTAQVVTTTNDDPPREIMTVVRRTQAEYDAIASPREDVLDVIVEE